MAVVGSGLLSQRHQLHNNLARARRGETPTTLIRRRCQLHTKITTPPVRQRSGRREIPKGRQRQLDQPHLRTQIPQRIRRLPMEKVQQRPDSVLHLRLPTQPRNRPHRSRRQTLRRQNLGTQQPHRVPRNSPRQLPRRTTNTSQAHLQGLPQHHRRRVSPCSCPRCSFSAVSRTFFMSWLVSHRGRPRVAELGYGVSLQRSYWMV